MIASFRSFRCIPDPTSALPELFCAPFFRQPCDPAFHGLVLPERWTVSNEQSARHLSLSLSVCTCVCFMNDALVSSPASPAPHSSPYGRSQSQTPRSAACPAWQSGHGFVRNAPGVAGAVCAGAILGWCKHCQGRFVIRDAESHAACDMFLLVVSPKLITSRPRAPSDPTLTLIRQS